MAVTIDPDPDPVLSVPPSPIVPTEDIVPFFGAWRLNRLWIAGAVGGLLFTYASPVTRFLATGLTSSETMNAADTPNAADTATNALDAAAAELENAAENASDNAASAASSPPPTRNEVRRSIKARARLLQGAGVPASSKSAVSKAPAKAFPSGAKLDPQAETKTGSAAALDRTSVGAVRTPAVEPQTAAGSAAPANEQSPMQQVPPPKTND